MMPPRRPRVRASHSPPRAGAAPPLTLSKEGRAEAWISAVRVDLGVPGVEIGHWSDLEARTGCTVIVLPGGTTASGEVRGGAPATRDFALLSPERLVECVDAIVFAGGSAFGLAAADGVMEVLEAEGRGFETAHGRVPIVVAMALYDLGVGQASVRPGAAAGRHAATNRGPASETGAVGAGAGATVSKWLGAGGVEPGGLGIASVRRDRLVVSAVVALNAAGSPPPAGERILDEIAAGSFNQWAQRADPLAKATGTETRAGQAERPRRSDPLASSTGTETQAGQAHRPRRADPLANTTLCAVVTNAALTKLDCFWVAQGGHDGLARSLVPSHSRSDGDAVVAAATGDVPADVDDVRLIAVAAVDRAVRSAAGTPPP